MTKITVILLIFFGLTYTPGANEEQKEKISKTFTFDGTSDKNLLIIENIFGSILIEGYQANQVLVDVDKVIEAESRTDLQEGIRDISLGVINTGDSIILYTESPYASLKRKNGKVSYQWDNGFGDIDYSFNFDYSVKVPYGTLVNVSTVNQGNVKIVDTRSTVKAHNVNGSVYLEKISAVTKATTINGVVEGEIIKKPLEDCSFKTINGDIRITFPSDLSADVSYNTMHGDFYTDFDFEILPGKVQSTKKNSKSGTKYKIEKNPKFRIGDGDVKIWFKTLNGDMILQMAK